MVRFVSKQVTSVLQQRPEIFKAGFQRVNKIDVQKSQDASFLKPWQGLIEIAHIEITHADIAELRDILLDLRKRAAKSALGIGLDFMLAHQDVSLVNVRGFRQPGKGIE